jgi:hypothetical protein
LVVHTFWPEIDPAAVDLLGTRLDAREVRAGGGLAEELAPHLVGVEHRPEVALLLLVAAVRDERRPEHADADDVEDPGTPARPISWEMITCSIGPRPWPPNSFGHVRPARPALGELPLPHAARGDHLVLVGDGIRALDDGRLGLVLLEPGTHRLTELRLFRTVVEVHGSLSLG